MTINVEVDVPKPCSGPDFHSCWTGRSVQAPHTYSLDSSRVREMGGMQTSTLVTCLSCDDIEDWASAHNGNLVC